MLLFLFVSIVILLIIYFVLENMNFRLIVKGILGTNNTNFNKMNIELSLYAANFNIINIDLLKHKQKLEKVVINRLKNGEHKFKNEKKHILKLVKKIEIVKLYFNFIALEPFNIDGYFDIILKLKVIHVLNMLKSIIYERGKLKKDERTSNRGINAYCNGKH